MKATVTPSGGLFGPSSITWRIHTETFAWPSELRALLLQGLHPRVMRGIAQNCLLTDPEQAWARFRRGMDFAAVCVFGTEHEAERAAARVREIHARLIGLDPDSGTLFRIDDPEHLRWAHCVEAGSRLEVARRSGVPLTAAEADGYLDEQRRSAALVGLDPSSVPGSVAELEDYFDETRPTLKVCDDAHDMLRRTIMPRFSPRLALVAPPLTLGSLPAAGALAYATLPRWAQELYGLPGAAATDLAADVVLRGLRLVATTLPDALTTPVIRDARRLMRATRTAGDVAHAVA